MIDFLLGGARSGKSRLAEQRASAAGGQVVYVATAQAHDDEMTSRIDHHQASRPAEWQTVEEPVALAGVLARYDQPGTVVLVDCLTLWMTNLVMSEDDDLLTREKQAFLQQIEQTEHSDVILVSNETGLGVVPLGELTRRFVDESGWLHQELAQRADQVTLVVAGLPHFLKPTGPQPRETN